MKLLPYTLTEIFCTFYTFLLPNYLFWKGGFMFESLFIRSSARASFCRGYYKFIHLEACQHWLH